MHYCISSPSPLFCSSINYQNASLSLMLFASSTPPSSPPLPSPLGLLPPRSRRPLPTLFHSVLRQNPNRSSSLPFCSILLSFDFHRHSLCYAANFFAWLCRTDCPCCLDTKIHRMAVRGFCERGRAFEALRVEREMLRNKLRIYKFNFILWLSFCPRSQIYAFQLKGWLRETRVQEALDLQFSIKSVVESDRGDGFGIGALTELLDWPIRFWEEQHKPTSEHLLPRSAFLRFAPMRPNAAASWPLQQLL